MGCPRSSSRAYPNNLSVCEFNRTILPWRFTITNGVRSGFYRQPEKLILFVRSHRNSGNLAVGADSAL